jgi:hypothetical protein
MMLPYAFPFTITYHCLGGKAKSVDYDPFLCQLFRSFFNDNVESVSEKGFEFLCFKDASLRWAKAEGVSVLHVREEYPRIYNKIMESESSKEHIVTGSPGIGKSLFGLWLVYQIMMGNKSNNKYPYTLLYQTVLVDMKVLLEVGEDGRLTSLEVISVPPKFVDYLIVDSADVGSTEPARKGVFISSIGNRFLAVAEEKWFQKNSDGYTYPMTVYSVEEIEAFSTNTMGHAKDTILTMYDIFGGSARFILQSIELIDHEEKSQKAVRDVEVEILTCMRDFFGAKNVCGKDGQHKVLFRAAALKLAKFIHKTSEKVDFLTRSLFIHHTETDEKICASPFLGYYAACNNAANKQDILTQIRKIFGSSGIGFLYEYAAHQEIIRNLTRGEKYRIERIDGGGSEDFSQEIAGTKLIRNVNDIEHLHKKDYGLPSITTFPLVDAVIKPNILLQMTIKSSHDTQSAHRIEDIIKAMKVKGNTKVKMIYVLPKESYENFKAGKFEKFKLASKHLVEYKMQYDLTASPPQPSAGSSASDKVNTEEIVGQKRSRGRPAKNISTGSQSLNNLEGEEGAALAKKPKTAYSSKQKSRSAKTTRGKGKSK